MVGIPEIEWPRFLELVRVAVDNLETPVMIKDVTQGVSRLAMERMSIKVSPKSLEKYIRRLTPEERANLGLPPKQLLWRERTDAVRLVLQKVTTPAPRSAEVAPRPKFSSSERFSMIGRSLDLPSPQPKKSW